MADVTTQDARQRPMPGDSLQPGVTVLVSSGDDTGGAVLAQHDAAYVVCSFLYLETGSRRYTHVEVYQDQLTALVEYVKRAFTMRQRNRAGLVLHNPRPWEG